MDQANGLLLAFAICMDEPKNKFCCVRCLEPSIEGYCSKGG